MHMSAYAHIYFILFLQRTSDFIMLRHLLHTTHIYLLTKKIPSFQVKTRNYFLLLSSAKNITVHPLPYTNPRTKTHLPMPHSHTHSLLLIKFPFPDAHIYLYTYIFCKYICIHFKAVSSSDPKLLEVKAPIRLF